MFYREEKKPTPIRKQPLKNLERIVAHKLLLQDKKRQELIHHIQKHLALSNRDYKEIAQPLIETMASFFQYLPDTSLYYSHRGGLLDLALNRTEAALALMHQLIVRTTESEPLSEQQKLWLYAVFSASLLTGTGKLYGEYKVNLYDKDGQFMQVWLPIHHNMNEQGEFYDFEFTRDINESGRTHVTVTLATRLMPEQGLIWLSSDPVVFYTWLALLEENKDGSGALDAILDRANAIAYQRYLLLYLEENKKLLEQNDHRLGTFQDATPQTILEKERVLGAEFLLWIHNNLADGRLLLNQASREAIVTPTGVVLSVEIFDQFMQEHLKVKKNKFALYRAMRSWQRDIQHHQETQQEQANVTQITLDNALLPETVKIISARANQIFRVRTLDLLHDIQAYSFEHDRLPVVLQQLNEHGQWVAEDAIQSRTSLGKKPGD
jgi:integrating conjugative element relaxase (TIGR03760 family)